MNLAIPRLSIPPVTRGLLLTFFTFSALYAGIQLQSHTPQQQQQQQYGPAYLVLVPGVSWKLPWTLLTATFVERGVLGLTTSGSAIYFGARYMERAWGGTELARFTLLLAVLPNLLCALLFGLVSYATGSSSFLLATINGSIAFQTGLLVAFRQLVPEHTVSLLRGLIRVRVKHFPAIFLALNSILPPLLGIPSAAVLVWSGFLTSWIYLRFFQATSSTAAQEDGETIKGDASDTFAFSNFFPEPIQSAVAPVCGAVHGHCVRLGLIPPFSDTAVAAGGRARSASAAAEEGQVRSAEAERRRALALRALEQKLSETAHPAGEPEAPAKTEVEG